MADDHGIIRQGIRLLLEQEPDIEVVGEAGDGRQAMEEAKRLRPEVVIMDITMPNLNGVDATRRLVSQLPDTKVIALSIHSGRHFVADMLRAGASGYLLKECLADELVRAIRTVVAGQVYLSPAAAKAVVETYVKDAPSSASGRPAALTDREREVLQLVAEGKTTKQIALKLHVSNKAIEATRRRVMDKLGIYSIAELTKYAIRQGLTTINS